MDIDGKVCADRKVRSGTKLGVDAAKTDVLTNENGRWSCMGSTGGSTRNNTDYDDIKPHTEKTLSWRFSDISKHKVTSQPEKTEQGMNKGWPGTTSGGTDTADKMAKDLSNKLTKEQKTKVAGLLSKTVSGGEVVEIRSVSTTSVMLNACYDLQSEEFSVDRKAGRENSKCLGTHSVDFKVKCRICM